MKPCKHGNHPFSFCQECCREMNEQTKREEENSVTCDCLDNEGNPHEECCLCAGTGFTQLKDNQ